MTYDDLTAAAYPPGSPRPHRFELGVAVYDHLKAAAATEAGHDDDAPPEWSIAPNPGGVDQPRLRLRWVETLFGVPVSVRDDMPSAAWRALDCDGQEVASGEMAEASGEAENHEATQVSGWEDREDG